MLKFTASEDGTSARLAKGEYFEISLPENPTTGFRWETTAASEPVYKLIHENFQPGTPVGRQGIHTWQFRAIRPGEGEIRMALRRSWETPGEPIQSFSLRVFVKA
jgi:inhibitor of cysteine peptidase